MLLTNIKAMTKQWMPLTDSQWDAISPFFNTKRKRTLDLRTVLDAIFYLLRTGCQWRNLPAEWPHWQAVYYYFDQWKKAGVYQKMNDELNKLDRMNEAREALPSALCADSQSVKLAPFIFEDRGLDPNKKVNGRKRQWLVDMGGRLWRAVVHAANGADGPSATVLLDNLDEINRRLELFFGDMAYNGVFADAVSAGGYQYEKRPNQRANRVLCLSKVVGLSNGVLPGRIFFVVSSKIMNIPCPHRKLFCT